MFRHCAFPGRSIDLAPTIPNWYRVYRPQLPRTAGDADAHGANTMHVIAQLMPEPADPPASPCTPQLESSLARSDPSCVSCALFQFTDLSCPRLQRRHTLPQAASRLYAWPYVKCVWILPLRLRRDSPEDLEMGPRAESAIAVLGPFHTEARYRAGTRSPPKLNHGLPKPSSQFEHL